MCLDHCTADYRIPELRNRTCLARRVGRCSGESIGTIREWAGCIVPYTAAVRRRAAEERCSVEYRHGAVSFRSASKLHPIRIDNRIGSYDGCDRRGGVDGHAQRGRGRTGVAGRIGRRRGEAVGAIGQRGRWCSSRPRCRWRCAAEQRRAVKDLHRALASAVPVSVSVSSLVMWSPTTPLSVRERGDARGHRRRGIDGHAQRRRGRAGIAGRIGRRRGQAVGAIGQRRGGVAPGAAAIGRGAAQQRRAVKHLDGAVGLRRAGQRQRVVIGDAVADHAAVGRERGDGRGHRRRRVDGHAQRRRGRAGIAGRIGRRRRQAVGAVGQRRGGVAPGPAAVGRGAAEQRRAVKDLDRAVGLRRAGQRQRVVIGDVVADRAAVGRERGDARGRRRRRIDGHAQRAGGRAGVAGGIGRRRGEAVGAVGKRSRWCSSRPRCRWPWRCRAASRRHRP